MIVFVFQHTVTAVIHLAGLKAVGESCDLPLLYYKTNVGGTTNLMEVKQTCSIIRTIQTDVTVWKKTGLLAALEEMSF